MKKLLKIALSAVVILLLVLFSAPLLLRDKIAEVVKREANEVLAAKFDFGSLNISFMRHFPKASLSMRGMTLVCTDRFEGATRAQVDRLWVVLNPLSLVCCSGFAVPELTPTAPPTHHPSYTTVTRARCSGNTPIAR